MDLENLKKIAKDFVDQRDWRKFQTTKELAANTSVEANELLELFMWRDGKEIDSKLLTGGDSELLRKVKNETADVFFSCLAIADQVGFDLGEAFLDKMGELEKRYDKEKVKGKVVKIHAKD
jgi:NTP pyrophosphatase (non-canonical NTP hydrolase)